MPQKKLPSKKFKPLVSVIICTRGRGLRIKKTIDSILKGTYRKIELLIVDNNDQKSVQLKQYCKKVKAKYLSGPKTSLSFGRNLGIKHAKGSIMAFTDDDCVADKNWLTEIVNQISDEIPMVLGTVRSFSSGLRNEPLDEPKIYDGLDFSAYKPWKMGHGANMAITKRAVKKIGYFDENFGPGAPWLNADDGDYIIRCLKANFKIKTAPLAIVNHEDKNRQQQLWDGYAYQYSYQKLLKKHLSLQSVAFLIFGPIWLTLAWWLHIPDEKFTSQLYFYKLQGFLGLPKPSISKI